MRIKPFTVLAAIAALVLLTSCGLHSLFKEGGSEYTIVIARDAPASERYAATELRDWIKAVSGVELPVTDLDGGQAGKRLVVGYNSLVENYFPDTVKPEDRDDSFEVRSREGDIFFWGGSKRGTLYSVYSFLEEELGCRWYSSKVSVAPSLSSWSFRNISRREEPGILIRDNCVLDVRTNPAFSARLRNNFIRLPGERPGETLPGTAEGYWGVHSMGYLITPAEFYSSHPEYFSLRDGKRQSGYSQLCLSNPEVLDLCVERIKDVMRREPDYLIYSMEQADNFLFCECDECAALAEKYGGQSGIMLWFVNQVADAVKEEFPDKFIGTFAYQYTRHAPKDIVPRDNVVIRLCGIECCMLHDYDDCERNVDFLKDLQEWSAIAPHLYIWDYVTDFLEYCLPVANWKTMRTHIQDFRDNNAIGILEEGDYQTTSCELREMRSWLLSKLMWNPDADLDALIKDFTDGYYGAAGPFVREYLDLEDRILRRPGIHGICYITPSDEMYTDEFITEGLRIFASAKEAVASDSVLYDRVETAEMPLRFLQLEKDPVKALQEGADTIFRRVVEREGIDRMAEGSWGGTYMTAKEVIDKYDKMARDMAGSRMLPSTRAETSGPGVSYIKYEGDFMSTDEMLSGGKVVEEGVMETIFIDPDPEKDHFGHVFDTWFMAVEDGFHRFKIVSDDGSVLFIDGQKVIDSDGSHSARTEWALVNLEKGLHRLTLRFFEDCEEQRLEVSVIAPDGYHGPLPADRLFVPDN